MLAQSAGVVRYSTKEAYSVAEANAGAKIVRMRSPLKVRSRKEKRYVKA